MLAKVTQVSDVAHGPLVAVILVIIGDVRGPDLPVIFVIVVMFVIVGPGEARDPVYH
jgi:hypothetical protein